MGVYGCELFGETSGYCCWLGAGFRVALSVGERDWLVWGSSCSLAGEAPDGAPEPLYVGPLGDGSDVGPPSGAGGGSG